MVNGPATHSLCVYKCFEIQNYMVINIFNNQFECLANKLNNKKKICFLNLTECLNLFGLIVKLAKKKNVVSIDMNHLKILKKKCFP